uniref:Uncharacterized protein n=1 Tax=Rhizophora mucronata TaxID=61149 RepID=A0A2P2KVD5_RHIMU
MQQQHNNLSLSSFYTHKQTNQPKMVTFYYCC